MGNEKKVINILTAFFISHKSSIKTIYSGLLMSALRALVSKTQYNFINIAILGNLI